MESPAPTPSLEIRKGAAVEKFYKCCLDDEVIAQETISKGEIVYRGEPVVVVTSILDRNSIIKISNSHTLEIQLPPYPLCTQVISLGKVHRIYPTLFRHSCVPNCLAYFFLDTMVVRALRNIQEGEPLRVCHSLSLLEGTPEERQAKIEAYYGYSCDCEACLSYLEVDWVKKLNWKYDRLCRKKEKRKRHMRRSPSEKAWFYQNLLCGTA